ncbi:MAG TPA: DUF4169 domain-containing protein [Rhodobacteraceae bacterium]|jgi:hypothetical protein|nr:DUF4169 domain-containing protein [Paracoccaceae bacterium]
MAEILNLNKQRKLRTRVAKRKAADENSVKFGRSKAERIATAARTNQARKMLDQHMLDEE